MIIQTRKSFKYRIYPTKAQITNLENQFSMCRHLNQRIKMRYHMTGLSHQDTIHYITARLKWSGCASPLFGNDALSAIHELSYGIPRLIGNVCEEALTYAMFCDKKTVDADMVLIAENIAQIIIVRQLSTKLQIGGAPKTLLNSF